MRLTVVGLVTAALACSQTAATPPKSKVQPVTDNFHGVKITDDYRWLENPDSPDTKDWIDREAAYTSSLLESLPDRAMLRRRMEQFVKYDRVEVPIVRRGNMFFSRRAGNQNQSVIYLRQNGEEYALVNPNKVGGNNVTSAQISAVRLDGKVLAYGIRKGGQDEVETHFIDADTRRLLPDELRYGRIDSLQLTPDGKGAYYTLMNPSVGPRFLYHTMGTDSKQDKEVFESHFGPDWDGSIDLSENGRYLLFEGYKGATGELSEIYLQDLTKGAAITPMVEKVKALFIPVWAGNELYVLTNWKAPNSRVLRVDLAHPGVENWKEVVPEQKAVLSQISPAGGKLILQYIENVSTHLKTVDSVGAVQHEIPLPAIGTVTGISSTWESDEVFYGFTSFTMPETIYRMAVSKLNQEVWSKPTIPLNAESVEAKQIWYTSKDGTRIPMFIISKRGTVLDGSRPTLLWGYGGFDVSLTPGYRSTIPIWIAQGGVMAIPNLRGGGEFGESWHHAGMLEKKQNVFDDFIAAAEWLIANRYTNRDHLAIEGVSNGGLLVGAVMTQRPDLFRAVLCRFPLLDMLRYQNFSIAKTWVSEYGSPDDPKQFQTLVAYSPYQHVKSGTKYPAVLFVTGAGDTRVDPLHARKMTALMQARAANGPDRPILLRYDKIGGHSGPGGLRELVDEGTDALSFLDWQLGVNLHDGETAAEGHQSSTAVRSH